MAGLVPATHATPLDPALPTEAPYPGAAAPRLGVGGRDEPGHDDLCDPNAIGQSHPMRGGWVYIVTNRPNGVLYLGVTGDLGRRVWQHQTGAYPGFTKRYGLDRLVWYECHDDIRTAIQRERNMKHWSRAWKVRVILDMNPDWSDLYDSLNA